MAIRAQDLADERTELHLHCRACGRTRVWGGAALVKDYGADIAIAQVVARARCTHDGMAPDAAIVLDRSAANVEAAKQQVIARAPAVFPSGRM